MNLYGKFLRDETGAITIDWVALTAGILLLGIMVVYAIFNGGVAGLVENVNDTLTAAGTDVDVGLEPALYDMALASGGKLPAGSEVTDSSFNLATGQIDTTFLLPDGSTVTTSEFNDYGNTVIASIPGPLPSDPPLTFPVSGGLSVGSTVNSGNSLNLSGGTGGTVLQSSVTGPSP